MDGEWWSAFVSSSGEKVLKEFQVETFADLTAQAPDLWKYATEDWCKVCEETHG